MKKFFFLLLLCAIAMPIWAEKEQDITPETVVYIQDGDTIRAMTVEEIQNELNSYEYTLKRTPYAYKQNGTLYIPMNPEYVKALKAQESIEAYEEECETRGQSFSKGYRQEWGQRDLFAAFIDTAMSVEGDASNRALNGHFYAGGYVFEQEFRVIEFDVNASNNSHQPSASASFKVLGQTIWSASKDLYWGKAWPYDPLFEKTARFWVGPVPMSVTATISGELRLYLGIELYEDGLGIEGDIIPGATLTGSVEAGPDIVVLKFGVEGEIDFIDVEMPFTPYTTYIPDAGLFIGLKIVLNLEVLRGRINIFVEVAILGRYELELWNWDGIKQDYILYDQRYPN